MATNTSDDLDLNNDAVSMNEHKEISMVTDSSFSVSASVSGTLAETGNDELRVCTGQENLLQQGVKGSEQSSKEKLNEGDESNVVHVSVNERDGVEREIPVEGKITEMKNEEGLNTKEKPLVNDDDIHEKPISLEENWIQEAPPDAGNPNEVADLSAVHTNEGVAEVGELDFDKVNGDEKMASYLAEGNFHNNGVPVTLDSNPVVNVVNEFVEPLLDMDADLSAVHTGEGVVEVDKLVLDKVIGDEKMVSYPAESSFYNNGLPVTLDSNPVVNVVNEFVEPLLDKAPEYVQETAEIVTSVETNNQTTEGETESKEADEKQKGNQTIGSDFYEVAVSQCYGPSFGPFGNLVVDLGRSPNKLGEEVIKSLDKPHSEKARVEEIGGDFFVSDLVWGKVKSHPWWPGQIFDPVDSSKLAKKNHKKDRLRYLVAYFGDQSFAWNVASSLKPFEAHFSQMEKQSNLEDFHWAIDSALDEISRRIQLGLACSCTPDEAYEEIKTQIVQNAGIRAESSRRIGVDKKYNATTFEPAKLLDCIQALALNPHGGVGNRLEFVVAKAQLVAFNRSKGYPQLPEFLSYGGLLVNEGENPTLILEKEEERFSGKRKLTSKDMVYSKRYKVSADDHSDLIMKERSLSELMGGESGSSDGKHNSFGSFSDDSMGRTHERMVSRSRTNDSKVGDGIRRPKTANPKEYSSPDEMLSQLHLAARDSMKGYSFLTTIVGFFTDFRNLISLESSDSGKKKRKAPQMKTNGSKAGARGRKSANSKPKSTNSETFDHKYMTDSYWTDMIVTDSSEEQASPKKQKRKRKSKHDTPKKDDNTGDLEENLQLKPTIITEEYRPEIPFQLDSTVSCEEQNPDSNTNSVTEEPVDRSKENSADDISPTALILNFTDANAIPSEMDLNKIFTRFGPLKESETEVLRKTSRAKVVFQRRSDAEIAFSSAGKFSIFGPALASYQLKVVTINTI